MANQIQPIAIDYFLIRFQDDEENQVNGDRYELRSDGTPFVFENQQQLDWFEGRIGALFRDYDDRGEVNVFAYEYADDPEESHEEQMLIEKTMAEAEARNEVYYCTVCHAVEVDALNGWDTCYECASRLDF